MRTKLNLAKLKIDKGVPIPNGSVAFRSGYKMLLTKMKVGDSILFKDAVAAGRTQVGLIGQGAKTTIKKYENGTSRLWLTKIPPKIGAAASKKK